MAAVSLFVSLLGRSSLVWGLFSIVWGLAIALATALLHRDTDKPNQHIFLIGTVLGSASTYYIVSSGAFQQWCGSRSAIPGCPGDCRKFPRLPNLLITLCLVVFMAVNMLTSSLALIRYGHRANQVSA